MKEVSSRVLRITAEALAAHRKRTVAEILAHAPYPEPISDGKMKWETYVRWVDTLNQSALAPIDWRAAGMECHESPSLVIFRGFLRLAVSVKTTYWLGCRWLGPSFFPFMASQYDDLSSDQVRLSLRLPAGASPCRSIFEMIEGNMISAPAKIFGLEPSQVETQISDREAIYLIRMPTFLTLWSRISFHLRNIGGTKILLGELVKQQQQLTEQSQRLSSTQTEFKTLVENFPDGVMIHRQGIITYVNPRMTSYLGYESQDPLLGKSALSIVHEDSVPLVRERMRAVQEHSRAVTPPREISFLKQGSSEPFSAEVVGLAITWEGSPATLVMSRDLTDRKKLQAHLMLTDRMTALGVLAAGVGHEINNPLGYTKLNLEALRDCMGSGDLQGSRKHLDEMFKGLERIRVIVKDLKTFSRGPNEVASEDLSAVDIQSVLQSVISMAKNEIQHRAKLIHELNELPKVRASEARLGQVFLNLLLNAAQAIPTGRADENQITLTTRVDELDRVVVEVRDTGAGMSEETQKRIFEPFFTTKAVGIGTGLGLSICHSIIEEFSGSIEFESALGKGTVFRVLLPSMEQSTAHVTKESAAAPAERIRGRVLIIDDDQALLTITNYFISRHHETIALTDARQGLELLEQGQTFDCIICDLMMPVLNGIGFHQAIARISPQHIPRTIFVTGGSFTQETDAFLKQPDVMHIDKPFDTDHLLAIIQEKVNLSRQGTTLELIHSEGCPNTNLYRTALQELGLTYRDIPQEKLAPGDPRTKLSSPSLLVVDADRSISRQITGTVLTEVSCGSCTFGNRSIHELKAQITSGLQKNL